MRVAPIVLATWVLSVNGTPIDVGKNHARQADTRPLDLKEGQQIASPCPDLIDSTTGITALYFYKPVTTEQRRSTLFINDHWGLSGCCDSQLHDACPSPPDPEPVFSPCPGLTTQSKTLLFFYLKPYTTDQIATDYSIIDALTNGKCNPSVERGGGSVSLLPGANMDRHKAGDVQSSDVVLPNNLNLPLASRLSPTSPTLGNGANTDTGGADDYDGYPGFEPNT